MLGYVYDDNLEPHATGFGPIPDIKDQCHWYRLS